MGKKKIKRLNFRDELNDRGNHLMLDFVFPRIRYSLRNKLTLVIFYATEYARLLLFVFTFASLFNNIFYL